MNEQKLYLIPTLLGDYDPALVLPAHTLEVVRHLKLFIAEEIRTARRFLVRVGTSTPVGDIRIILLNEHSTEADIYNILEILKEGQPAGLISEAGAPCVADPGSGVVRLCHQAGIRVIPLTGPSSLLLALMASGLNGQSFVFLGYLPVDRPLRIRRIREIERDSREKDQTQIFIETPYRNRALLQDILTVCKENTLLCIATDITSQTESILTLPISEWKLRPPDIHKRPAVFLLYHDR